LSFALEFWGIFFLVQNVLFFFNITPMCSILPVFLKKSVINNGIKSATPLKILSFEEKLSGISFFSRVWHMGGKVLPKVEFFA
jgi:hypothetical protein